MQQLDHRPMLHNNSDTSKNCSNNKQYDVVTSSSRNMLSVGIASNLLAAIIHSRHELCTNNNNMLPSILSSYLKQKLLMGLDSSSNNNSNSNPPYHFWSLSSPILGSCH